MFCMRFSQTHLDETINHRDILLSHCPTVLLTRCHSVLLPHYPTGPSLMPPPIPLLARYSTIPLSRCHAISPFRCPMVLPSCYPAVPLSGSLIISLTHCSTVTLTGSIPLWCTFWRVPQVLVWYVLQRVVLGISARTLVYGAVMGFLHP